MQENQSLGFMTKFDTKICKITEGKKLEISDVRRRGFILSDLQKSTDQLCSYSTADLCLFYFIGKIWLSHESAQFLSAQLDIRVWVGKYNVPISAIVDLMPTCQQVCVVQ